MMNKYNSKNQDKNFHFVFCQWRYPTGPLSNLDSFRVLAFFVGIPVSEVSLCVVTIFEELCDSCCELFSFSARDMER
jgi:hypothetical protein